MPVPQRYLAALQAVPVLSDLDRAGLEVVCDVGSLQKFPAGTRLMETGQLGMEAYILLAGEVRVSLPGGAEDVSRAGDIVGEMALLGQATNRRNATVTTVSEVEALVINRHYFEMLLNENPAVGKRIEDRIRERAQSAG
jgi:CRP-like cAMP-binding protein